MKIKFIKILAVITTMFFASCSVESIDPALANQNTNQQSSNPIGTPVLTTLLVNGISSISAISGGNITSEGNSPVTSRGVVWATTINCF